MLRVAVFCLCLAVSLGANTNTNIKTEKKWSGPSFCNGLDCPVYSVLEKGDGYELRRYPSAQWVSTSYSANGYEEADRKSSEAFMTLFNYINGENVEGMTIPMTTPVLTKVTPGPGPNCNSEFVKSFFVPFKLQGSAPTPSNSNVFLQTTEQMDVYVRSFSGFAHSEEYLQATMDLAEALGDMSKLEFTSYLTAGYDSPFKWWDRHNESWMSAAKAEV